MGYSQSNGSCINEIVFENRNKTYGAYVIRKEYDTALNKSFGIVVILILGLIGLFRLLSHENVRETLHKINEKQVITPIDMTPSKAPEKAIETPAHKQPVVNPDHAKGPPVVTDSVVKQDTTKSAEPSKPQVISKGNPGTDTSRVTGNKPGIEQKPAKVPTFLPEHMPEFPGGEAALMDYLSTHIRYTSMALSAGIHGTMVLRFVVGIDGSITEIQVLKKLGAGCEAQATEVVKGMPKWKPGSMGGEPVPVYYTLPILYKLQD